MAKENWNSLNNQILSSIADNTKNTADHTKETADAIKTPGTPQNFKEVALSVALGSFLSGDNSINTYEQLSTKSKDIKAFHDSIFNATEKFSNLADAFTSESEKDNILMTIAYESADKIITKISEKLDTVLTTLKSGKSGEPISDIVCGGFNSVFNSLIDIKGVIEKLINKTNNNIDNINNEPQKVEANIKTNLSDNTIQSLIKFLTDLSSTKLSKEQLDQLDENIKKLGSILVGNTGNSLLAITKSLSELGTVSEQQKSAIEAVKYLFDALSSATEIGPLGRRRIRKNIRFIRNYIVNDIVELTKDLEKTSKELGDPSITKSFIAVNNFFDTIVSLGELDPQKQADIDDNLDFIKYIICNRFINLIKKLDKELKDATSNIDSIQKSVLAFNGLIGTITSLAEYDIDDIITMEYNMHSLVDAIKESFVEFSKFTESGEVNIPSMSEFLKALNKDVLLQMYGLLDGMPAGTELTKNIIKLSLFAVKVSLIKNIVTQFNNIDLISETTKQTINEDFPQIIDNLAKSYDKLQNITITGADKKIESFSTLLESIEQLGKMNLAAKSIEHSIKALNGVATAINDVLHKFDELEAYKIKEATNTIKTFTKMIIRCGFMLIAASILMTLVKPKNLLIFTTTLSVFLFTIGGIFRLFNRGFKNSMKGVKDAALLVALCGAILIAGSMLFRLVDFSAAMGFVVALGSFLFAIGFVFLLFNRGFRNAMRGAKNAALIITVCGALLIAGGLIFKYMDWDATFGFITAFGTFFFAIIAILAIGGWRAGKAMADAGKLAILLVVCGGILLAGGLIYKNIDKKATIKFCVMLAGFIFTIIAIMKFGGHEAADAMNGAKKLAILLVVSAAILIAGGLILKHNPDLVIWSTLFGAILALFIWGITQPFKNKNAEFAKGIAAATQLGILVGISAAVLLVGGYVIKKNGGLKFVADIGLFAATLMGFTYGMVKITNIIGEAASTGSFKKGLLGMAAIEALTLGGAYVMKKMGEAMKIGGFWNIVKGVGAMAAVVAGITGIAFALGTALMTPAAIVIGVGAAGMAGVVAFALGLSAAMRAAAMATIAAEFVDFDILKEAMEGWSEIFEAAAPLAKGFGTITKIAYAITSMSIALAQTADVMQAYANLTIPVYKGTKIVGYKTITDQDFPKAATNIKRIVTTLAQAIVEIYEQKPDIFDAPDVNLNIAGGLFSIPIPGAARTPFQKVVKSLQAMAPMLSAVADAMKDWSDLRIPVYKGTKIAGYKTITNQDFPKAAIHIKEVIKTLAGAIVDVYNEDTKHVLFEAGDIPTLKIGFGLYSIPMPALAKTPFQRVTKSLQVLGPMLSAIADAVKDWSELRVPIYGEGGKITGYKTIGDKEFEDAGGHIKEVVKTLAQAVIDVAERNPELFGVGDIKGSMLLNPAKLLSAVGLTKTPFAKVANTLNVLGPMLSSIADAVKNWANLTYPIYKQGSTEIASYKVMTPTDIKNAGDKIAEVLTAIGTALVTTVEGHDKIFGDTFGDSSPARRAAEAMKIITGVISGMASTIGWYAKGEFPILKWVNGKLTTAETVKNVDTKLIEKARNRIKSVIEGIGIALIESMENEKIKKYFTPFTNANTNPVMMFANSLKTTAQTLMTLVNVVGQISKMQIDDVINNLNNKENGVKTKLINMVTAIAEIFLLFSKSGGTNEVSIDEKRRKTYLFGLIKGGEKNEAKSIAEFCNDHIADIEEFVKSTQTFTNKISDLLDTVGKLFKTFKENEQAYQWFIGGSFSGKDEKGKNFTENYSGEKSAISIINSILYTYVRMLEQFTKKRTINGSKEILSEYIKDNTELLNSYKPQLTTLNDVIEDVLKKGSKILEAGNEYLKIASVGNMNLLMIKFSTMMSYYQEVLDSMLTEPFIKSLAKMRQEDKNLKYIKKLNDYVQALYDTILYMSSIVSAYQEVDSKKIKSMVTNFNAAVNELYNIGGNVDISDANNGLMQVGAQIAIMSVKEQIIKRFMNSLERIVKSAEYANDIGIGSFNVLRDGILKIYGATTNIRENKPFNQHANKMKDYVRTINSINLNKLNTLINLFSILDRLAVREGSLSNLTVALSETLSSVLSELSAELSDAKNTINTIQKIQDERHKKIKEAVKEVQTLMSSTINVTIKQDSTSLTTDPNATTTTPTPTGETQKQNNSVTPAVAGADTVTDQGDSKKGKKVGSKDKPNTNPTTKQTTTQAPFIQQNKGISWNTVADKLKNEYGFLTRERGANKRGQTQK